jgi:hypothetical protein
MRPGAGVKLANVIAPQKATIVGSSLSRVLHFVRILDSGFFVRTVWRRTGCERTRATTVGVVLGLILLSGVSSFGLHQTSAHLRGIHLSRTVERHTFIAPPLSDSPLPRVSCERLTELPVTSEACGQAKMTLTRGAGSRPQVRQILLLLRFKLAFRSSSQDPEGLT